MVSLARINQYKSDFFDKLDFRFEPDASILDVGCGDCTDIKIFRERFGLKVQGIDIYQHENVDRLAVQFMKASILGIPFEDDSFDYVFTHDVLHHVDKGNDFDKLVKALTELMRVAKPGGHVIVIEGNRFNPLFYPHMVLLKRHNHLKQSYFMDIVSQTLGPAEFRFFEVHLYPRWCLKLFKVYERVMEKYAPRRFLAYTVAISKKMA